MVTCYKLLQVVSILAYAGVILWLTMLVTRDKYYKNHDRDWKTTLQFILMMLSVGIFAYGIAEIMREVFRRFF